MVEEPVKPRGHKSKPQPASMSTFDRAMELERDNKVVGAGV